MVMRWNTTSDPYININNRIQYVHCRIYVLELIIILAIALVMTIICCNCCDTYIWPCKPGYKYLNRETRYKAMKHPKIYMMDIHGKQICGLLLNQCLEIRMQCWQILIWILPTLKIDTKIIFITIMGHKNTWGMVIWFWYSLFVVEYVLLWSWSNTTIIIRTHQTCNTLSRWINFKYDK